MNRRQALTRAREILEDRRIEDPSLEGEVLLRHVLGVNRAVLFASLDEEIPEEQYDKLLGLVERRCNGEPSAYITGHKEFYGLDLKVDPRVLIPRPETEIIVEKAIAYCRENGCKTVADIGTGSGCIAVSLAKYLPGVKVFAVDISPKALELAGENIAAHGVEDGIVTLAGNLLEPLPEPVDIITANLPYVRSGEVDSRYEPQSALDGGVNGLDKFGEILPMIPGKLNPAGLVLMEIGLGQVGEISDMINRRFSGAAVEIINDLAGIERVICLRLTPPSVQ